MKEKCVKLHDGAFYRHPGSFGDIQLQEINTELLERHAGLRSWRSGREASLFLLIGDNVEDNDYNRGLLWLSPAALQISQSFDSTRHSAFYSPSPQQPRGYQTLKVPVNHLLSSVIHQLLLSSRVLFEAHGDRIYRQLKQEQDGLCDRRAILRTLLRLFPESDTVVIVLDRLDLIEPIDPIDVADLGTWDVIDQFVALMADAEIVCTVKLAVVGLQKAIRKVEHVNEVAKKRKWAQIRGNNISVHGKLDWRQEALADY